MLKRFKNWVRFRVWDRRTVIKINTLVPDWWDSDTLLLHSMFQILTDYVEIELGCMGLWSIDSWWRKVPIFLIPKRLLKKHGLKYLRDETLFRDTFLAPQKESAKTIRKLYYWWTVTRVNRIDVTDNSISWLDMSEKEREDMVEHSTRQTADNDFEDEQMMIKLVKIRGYLWT